MGCVPAKATAPSETAPLESSRAKSYVRPISNKNGQKRQSNERHPRETSRPTSDRHGHDRRRSRSDSLGGRSRRQATLDSIKVVEVKPERPKLPDEGEHLQLEENWELENCEDVLDIPISNSSYALPKPAKTQPEFPDYYDADKVGLTTAGEHASSFGDLAVQLTKDLEDDAMKVRAIMAWISGQKIRTRQYSSELNVNTPLGHMKLIKEKKASFASLFTLICRTACIPCVIIKGTQKTHYFQVGDAEMKDSASTWTAVYVNRQWHLVHPFLICTPLSQETGYGDWHIVENSNRVSPNTDNSNSRVFNEFFFFSSPKDFVHVCLPLRDFAEWQLLEKRLKFKEFRNLSFLRPAYFNLGLLLQNEHKSILNATEGICNIEFHLPDSEEGSKGFRIMCDLFTRDNEFQADNNWGQLVLSSRRGSAWNIQVRFPVKGTFKLSVYANRAGKETQWIGDIGIECEVPKWDFRPPPIDPGMLGWGPGPQTESAGLLAPSHLEGVIQVKPNEEHIFKFILAQRVKLKAELVHNSLSKETLSKYVTKMVKQKELDVHVTIPDAGEFALMLYVLCSNGVDYKNVCNYLLTDTQMGAKKGRKRETVPQKRARHTLRKSACGHSVDELVDAIDTFTKVKLDDDDDLSRARRRLTYLKLKKGLRDAIMRRHDLTLEKAIDEARSSPYSTVLSSHIEQAETLLDHLLKLETHCHDVLEMKQTTISELANYVGPTREVHSTMMATFLLLGEEKKYLENWGHIQALLRKQGPMNIITRIRHFTGEVEDNILLVTERVLKSVDEDSVHSASSGAATFYQWTTNVLKELREGTFENNFSQNADDMSDSCDFSSGLSYQ